MIYRIEYDYMDYRVMMIMPLDGDWLDGYIIGDRAHL
jgi:hypothetical protein